MLVNIRLEGSDLHWVVTQKSVRIGRGADCEVAVPAERYPMVSREHLTLTVEGGQVRFTDPGSANGTYVNGNRMSSGRLVSGDIVQLGHNGPRLILEVDSVAASSVASASTMVGDVGVAPVTPASVAPTMVGFGPGGAGASADGRPQETSVEDLGAMMDETMDIPHEAPPSAANAATMVRQVQDPKDAKTEVRSVNPQANAPTVIGKAVWEPPAPESARTVVVPGFEAASPSAQEEEQHGTQAEEADEGVEQEEVAEHQEMEETVVEESAAHTGEHAVAATETGLSAEEELMLERKLDSMKTLVTVLAVMVVALLGFSFYQSQQIDKNIKAVDNLRKQAEGAVSQLTPALDQRLNALDKRLDSVDDKMKQAEDRMVNRMNAEIPAMLDKYVNKKMDELNKQAATMQPR